MWSVFGEGVAESHEEGDGEENFGVEGEFVFEFGEEVFVGEGGDEEAEGDEDDPGVEAGSFDANDAEEDDEEAQEPADDLEGCFEHGLYYTVLG